MKKIIQFFSIFTLALVTFSLNPPITIEANENVDVWYDQNGNAIPKSVESVVVFDSRENQMTTFGPVMPTDYSMVYNHYANLRTSSGPYSVMTSIDVGITIRVDFYKNGTIKKIGTPSYYYTTLRNLAGNPSLSKTLSTSKISSTKYRITPRIQITSIPLSPIYTGSIDKQT